MSDGLEHVDGISSLNQIGIRDGRVWIVAEEVVWRRAFGAIPRNVDIDVDSNGLVRVYQGVNYEVRDWEITHEGGGSPRHYLASRQLEDESRRPKSASSVTTKLEVTPGCIQTKHSLEVSDSGRVSKKSIGASVALIVCFFVALMAANYEGNSIDLSMVTGDESQKADKSRTTGPAQEPPTQSEAIANLVSEASGDESELVRVLNLPDNLNTSLVPVEVGSKTDEKTTLSWYSDRGLLIFGSVIDRRGRDLTRLVQISNGIGRGQGQGASPNQQNSQDVATDLSDEISSSGDVDAKQAKEAANEQASNEMVWPLSRVYEQIQESVSYFPNNGQDGRYIYVFVDPQCPYCEELYSEIMTSEGLDSSLVRWVPVAVLGRSSLPKAAKLLATGTAAETLQDVSEDTDSDLAEKIVENTRVLLYSSERVATPTLIWRSDDGVESYVGSPSKARLKDIFNSISDANGGHNDERGTAAS